MAKNMRKGHRAGGLKPNGGFARQPANKQKPDLPTKGDLPDVIPVDPTRATVPIPGLRAGKRRT